KRNAVHVSYSLSIEEQRSSIRCPSATWDYLPLTLKSSKSDRASALVHRPTLPASVLALSLASSCLWTLLTPQGLQQLPESPCLPSSRGRTGRSWPCLCLLPRGPARGPHSADFTLRGRAWSSPGSACPRDPGSGTG